MTVHNGTLSSGSDAREEIVLYQTPREKSGFFSSRNAAALGVQHAPPTSLSFLPLFRRRARVSGRSLGRVHTLIREDISSWAHYAALPTRPDVWEQNKEHLKWGSRHCPTKDVLIKEASYDPVCNYLRT